VTGIQTLVCIPPYQYINQSLGLPKLDRFGYFHTDLLYTIQSLYGVLHKLRMLFHKTATIVVSRDFKA